MKRALLIGKPREIAELKNIIPLADYQAIGTSTHGIEALRLLHRLEPEMVIMSWNISGLSAFDLLQNILSQRLCPVIVVISQEHTSVLSSIIQLNAHYVLVQPLRAFDLITAILYAEHRFSEEQATAHSLSRLESELKTRKIQYQALLTVILKTGLDEKTAYRKIQQYAMSKRKTLYSVSVEILKGNWLPD